MTRGDVAELREPGPEGASPAAAGPGDGDDDGPTGPPAGFEHMYWFPLPPICLEQSRTGNGCTEYPGYPTGYTRGELNPCRPSN